MEKDKKLRKSKDIIHISFELGLLIKGIDGLLEILGGFLLLFLSPGRLNSLTTILTRHELSEDPKDLVANALVRFSYSFSISTQYFGVFYLISHGIIKCVLILLLWKKKLWAYPLTIISLILFIAYQIYRYSVSQSASLLVLTAFDIIMIILTSIEYNEYKRMKIHLI
jgi:uncharacterized membrane protein